MTGAPSRPWSLAEIIDDLDPDGKIRADIRAGDARAVSPASSPAAPGPDRDDVPPLARRVDRARRYLARKPGGVQGAFGSNATYDAARDLVRGFLLDESTALGLMLSDFNPKCEPAWTVAQLEHKLRDAATKPYGKPPGYLLTRKDDRPRPAAGPAVASATPPAPQPASPPPGPPAGPATPPVVEPPADRPLNEADYDPHMLARALLAGYLSRGRRTLAYWQGEFHAWDSTRYRTVADKVFRPTTNRTVHRELAAVHRDRLKGWEADGCQGEPPKMPKVTDALVSNVLAALQGMTLVADADDAPAWVHGSAGPDPRETVAAANGLVHLPAYAARTPDAIRENTPHYLNFNAVEFPADPAAPPPAAWLAFLAELWPADPESVALLQEWFGYLLTPDNRMQKMLLLIGPPRSGKGTIARVLQELVGPSNVGNPTLGSLGGDFGLESLVGKSVAVVEDARLSKRTDSAVVTERLLTISGGGRIDINRKHKAHFTGRLTTRFVVATNEIPDLSDASGALANRWCLLRLTQSFLGREDDALVDRLLAELPGIFNWAADGWRRLRAQRRFTAPTASNDLVEDMHDNGSPVGEFVKEACVVGPNWVVEKADLYQAWRKWCEVAGRKEPGTVNTFGRQLRAYLHQIRRTRPRRDGEQIECYQGIAIRPLFSSCDGLDDRLPFEGDNCRMRATEGDGEGDNRIGGNPLLCQAVATSEGDEGDSFPVIAYGQNAHQLPMGGNKEAAENRSHRPHPLQSVEEVSEFGENECRPHASLTRPQLNSAITNRTQPAPRSAFGEGEL